MRTDCYSSTKCTDGAGVDGNGHGTHVAGIAAAIDNGFGVVGVAPGARLWSVRVLGNDGSGTLSGLVSGIDWVTAHADTIDVANISITCDCISTAIDTALSRANAAGVTIAVAAGNSSTDAGNFSISNSPAVLTVSALTDYNGVSGGGAPATCRPGVDDQLADYSNFGAVVDLAAPGTCITSTWLGGGYNTISGTSMASPHVAGAAALLASQPAYHGNTSAIRARLIADGNTGWTDTSGDGVTEPLLDVTNLGATTVPGAAPLTLSVDDVWAPEGSVGQIRVRASRTLVGGEDVRAVLSTDTKGTATAGADFGALNAVPVHLIAGQSQVTVPINLFADTVPEGNETVTATLSKVVGAGLTDSAATVTIYDVGGPIGISIGDVTAHEGAQPSVDVRLSSPVPTGQKVTGVVTASGGSATSGADYVPVPATTLTFLPGDQVKSVPLTFLTDSLREGDETITLTLGSVVGARVSDGSATATILDASGPIEVSLGNAWQAEGNSGTTPMPIPVTLSAPPGPGQVVTVTVKTANSTARSGTDYVALGSTKVTFLAGETAKSVNVSVIGDVTPEGNETFTLTASAVTGAVLADATATATIANDDGATPAPAPRWLAVSDGYLTESGSGQSGTVDLWLTTAPGPGETVSVTVASTDGTATAGTDYNDVPSTVVTFGEGETHKTVAVSALSDALGEPTETFSLTLTSVTGAVASDTTSTVRIVSDDPATRVSADDVTFVEGDAGQSTATVTVRLSSAPAAGQSMSVVAATAAGTASAGSDFAAVAPTTLTFGPGQLTSTVPVQVNGDTLHEGNEALTVVLSTPVGVAVEDSSGTITIVDEEGPVTAVVANAAQPEGNAPAAQPLITVGLSSAPGAGQTFTLKLVSSAGTATPGTDYTALPSTTVTFTAGQDSATLPLTVLGDTTSELDETVVINASTPTGGVVVADGSGLVTLLNDD